MPGTGRTLRVAIVGVRVQDARRYHISIQVLGPGALPVGVAVGNDSASAAKADQVGAAVAAWGSRLDQGLASTEREEDRLSSIRYGGSLLAASCSARMQTTGRGACP